ncbi:MAG: class I SAM-dependent methyltransferase [FCB group bacterium]|nr:class I SAM-dependent methyltransferase [FCB group bacterium]
MKSAEKLDERYRTGDLPWDTGKPNSHLLQFFSEEKITSGHVLDIGTGTGTNAIWLAKLGFTVEGLDLSPVAIEMAREKAAKASATVNFISGDFLRYEHKGQPFDVVFDRGCFHTFDTPAERNQFAEKVHELLAQNGLWFSIIGSTDGPPRTTGPPRLSVREIAEAIEPKFEIRYIKAIQFEIVTTPFPLGWLCLARKRRHYTG